jgi:hypothetical protein
MSRAGPNEVRRRSIVLRLLGAWLFVAAGELCLAGLACNFELDVGDVDRFLFFDVIL